MKNTPLVVLNASKSTLSDNFIRKLDGSKYFTMEDNILSFSEIDKAFEAGKCKVALVFPKNFEDDYVKTKHAEIQVIVDASDPNEASTIENYLEIILLQYQQELSGDNSLKMSINGEVKMLYNPQIKSAYNFVPGLMGMLMMIICALMTSISIVREKENGTMEILLISPLRPTSIVLAKAVPYFVVSMIDVILILLIAHFIMGVPIVGSIFTILILSVVFTLAALSLGLLVSSLTSDQQTAMIIALLGTMVPSMLLSGILFPIESMPTLLQYLSDIIPAKWYIAAIRGIMIKGAGILDIWREIAVLTAMTVFLLFISIQKLKSRL
jgi:ABC-2 type transport system permease protein